MKPYQAWTYQNNADAGKVYTLYGVEEPNWRNAIASAGEEYTLIERRPVTFRCQGEAETLARELTALTGAAWDYDLSHAHPDHPDKVDFKLIRTADGLAIFFDTDFNGHNQGRWHFSYSRPRGPEGHISVYDPNRPGYELKNPEITVGKSRGAPVVAKEIARRLIPDAEKIHPEVLARIASQGQAKQNQKDSITALCQALGCPEPNPGRDSFYFKYGGHQDCQVNYGGSVNFTFRSLSLDKALALAKWLASNADRPA